MKLPTKLSDKASIFPETGYGASTVTLLLQDGRKIRNVILAWGSEIIKIDGILIEEIENLGFEIRDIADVLPE